MEWQEVRSKKKEARGKKKDIRFFMITIKQITPIETYTLRLEVLKTNADYIYQYQGDFDEKTVHYGAFDADKNIGIITLMENENPLFQGKQMQLRGMAVATNAQNKGIGKTLVQKVIKISNAKEAKILWCNAREQVVDFYKKQGFQIEGERFYIEHVCYHYLMYKKL